MASKLRVVNNDTFIPKKGDIVCGSGESYGVKLALADTANLALLGVWENPVAEGREGDIINGIVEVNCLTLPQIGDKLYLSDTVAGKAVVLPPLYSYYLGTVIARYRTGNLFKALIPLAQSIEVTGEASGIDYVARASAADAQSTADDAINIANAAVNETLNRVPNTRTVNGKALSANITLDKTDIGLGNVDNTSDANKPVSTATQNALNLKADVTDLTLLLDRVGQALSTGVVWGLEVTINELDHSHFDVGPGAAMVVDHSTDPDQPVIYYLNYPGTTGIPATQIADGDLTNLMFDRNGQLVQTLSDVTPVMRRDYAVFGWLQHTTRTVIESCKLEPEPISSAGVSQMLDFLTVFGPLNVTGNTLHADTASLKLSITAGETFDPGTNAENNYKNPNIFPSPDIPESPLLYYHRDATSEWVNDAIYVSDVDPNYYDTGSGKVAVPSGKFTIQPVFYYAPQGDVDIQYGQVVYNTLDEAVSNINSPIDINPYLSYDTHRGWLILQQGATSLLDTNTCRIIPAGKWGLISVASGGGSGGEVNTASNINTRGEGVFDRKLGVDLQFRGIAAGSGKISVTHVANDNVLEIDVVQSALEAANSTTDGQMSSTDKVKLDGINLLYGTSNTPPSPTGLAENTIYFRHE